MRFIALYAANSTFLLLMLEQFAAYNQSKVDIKLRTSSIASAALWP
jgi:hypothetical protein